MWARVSVALVRDRSGEPLCHVAQVQDIDARRRAEAGLRAAKQRAEYREREKSLLLEQLNEAQRIARIGYRSLDRLTSAAWWSDEMYRTFAVDPAMTVLVRELLADDHVKVDIATDPGEALAMLRATIDDFDLVITDFNMPGLSGLELAREVAQLRPDLPVVVTSGYVIPALQEAVDNGLIRTLVNKVETVEVLPRLVREILASLPPPRAARPH